MYTDPADIAQLEQKLGCPTETRMEYEIHPWEFDVVESSMSKGRAHDVTMFIRKKDDSKRVAVIRKPFFPPGAFRAPSGAANAGEALEMGAIRESREETGLEVELTRYLVRILATFTCGEKTISWTTHIFEAVERDGELVPQDTGEIAEARWATLSELGGPIRQTLLDAGWDLFRYRVALTDLTLEKMS